MQTGRNDPCPCGSGKKYKKCCLPNQSEAKSIAPPFDGDDDQIAPGEFGDYGTPDLSQEFFDANPMVELSAQNLVWNMAKQPELGSQAAKMTRQLIHRGKDEARRIEKAKTAAELVRIMKENPDPLNHSLLLDKVLNHGPEAVRLILNELAEPQRNSFTELAVQVIFRSNIDVVDGLLVLVNESIALPYDLSLVCMLLGMCEAEEAVKSLWDCFHFLKEKFPDRLYAQGPLIGLLDIKYRRDNPIEISEEQRVQAEQALRQSGLDVSSSTVETILKLIFQRRIIKVIRILHDETGVESEQAVLAVKDILENMVHSRKDSNDSHGNQITNNPG